MTLALLVLLRNSRLVLSSSSSDARYYDHKNKTIRRQHCEGGGAQSQSSSAPPNRNKLHCFGVMVLIENKSNPDALFFSASPHFLLLSPTISCAADKFFRSRCQPSLLLSFLGELARDHHFSSKSSREMPPRGYVLILVSWVLLTVITPTLIYWSASAKSYLVAPGEALLETQVSRRMMGSMDNGSLKKSRMRTIARAMMPAADPAPAPMAGDDTPGQS